VTTRDPWAPLRRWTSARIGLGRAGGSLPTAARLEFRLAHAAAQDAVTTAFRPETMAPVARELGLAHVTVASAADSLATYLTRPDLGRRLDDAGRAALGPRRAPCDVVLVVAGGLSAGAAHDEAPALVRALVPLLRQRGLGVGPLVTAARARVALADEIGEVLGARAALILLGERPGLKSPRSLGAYLVLGPRRGRTDAERNCVSNIHPNGLAPDAAARKLAWLTGEALARGVSGVGLKDEEPALPPAAAPPADVTGGSSRRTLS
jgi:ethanolamine ammonia-lyase small subunit